MRKRKLNVKRLITVLSGLTIIILVAIMVTNSNRFNIAKESPSPTASTVTPVSTPPTQIGRASCRERV